MTWWFNLLKLNSLLNVSRNPLLCRIYLSFDDFFSKSLSWVKRENPKKYKIRWRKFYKITQLFLFLPCYFFGVINSRVWHFKCHLWHKDSIYLHKSDKNISRVVYKYNIYYIFFVLLATGEQYTYIFCKKSARLWPL